MKIYAPVADSNGVWCSVRFVNGVGETDNPNLIKWFKDHGYKVEGGHTSPKVDLETQLSHFVENDEIENTDDQVVDTKKKVTENFESMTPNQLRDWLKANGYASQIGNIRNKEKLLKIIRG